MNHGGSRKGAGRKPGRQNESKSISMTTKKWDRLDAIRGTEKRGQYLAKKIK